MTFDSTQITHLTFDCYGTLVDWETGILSTVRPFLTRKNRNITDAGILELYGKLEWEEESGPYKTYREVLQVVLSKISSRLVLDIEPNEINALADALPGWPVYPDTKKALQRLKSRFKLAIISNTDDDLFAQTNKAIGVDFDAIITAEQARSYKPSLNNFHLAIEKLGITREALLHVGQSVSHDIVPAKSLGLATAWVNRRPGTALFGNRPHPSGQPNLEVHNLDALANELLAK